jgi:hypothetical protein
MPSHVGITNTLKPSAKVAFVFLVSPRKLRRGEHVMRLMIVSKITWPDETIIPSRYQETLFDDQNKLRSSMVNEIG